MSNYVFSEIYSARRMAISGNCFGTVTMNFVFKGKLKDNNQRKCYCGATAGFVKDIVIKVNIKGAMCSQRK